MAASAAIAIHTDADKGSHITIAVQCRRTADVVMFRSREGRVGLDGDAEQSALLWAEGMGFLFDEELCTDPRSETGVRNELATEIWRELTQESRPAPADAEPRSGSAEPVAATMLSKFRIQRAAWSHVDQEIPGRWEPADRKDGGRAWPLMSSLEPQDRSA